MKPVKKNAQAQEPEAAVIATEAEGQPVEASVETTASAKDYVRVTMLEEVSPPPVIGHFNFAAELGVTKLENRKTYSVPREAAARLQDTGMAVMLLD